MTIHPSGYFNIGNYVKEQFNLPNDLTVEISLPEAGHVPTRQKVIKDMPRLGHLTVNHQSVKVDQDPSINERVKASSVFSQVAQNLKGNALNAYLAAQALNLLEQDMSHQVLEAVKMHKEIHSGIETGDQFANTKAVSCTITTKGSQMTVIREEMVQVDKNTADGDRKLEGFFKVKMTYEGHQDDFISRNAAALKSTAAFTKTYPTMKKAQSGKYENNLIA